MALVTEPLITEEEKSKIVTVFLNGKGLNFCKTMQDYLSKNGGTFYVGNSVTKSFMELVYLRVCETDNQRDVIL